MRLPILVAAFALSASPALALADVEPGLIDLDATAIVDGARSLLATGVEAPAPMLDTPDATSVAAVELPQGARPALPALGVALPLLLLPDGGLLASYGGATALAAPTAFGVAFDAPVRPAQAPMAAFVRAAPAADAEPAPLEAAPVAIRADPTPTTVAPAADATTPQPARPVGAYVAGGIGAGLVTLIGAALYHRIRPNAALENDTRKVIFDAVCAQPGMGVHSIAEVAHVSYSTATYHLERLVAAGMLVMTPDGNKLCYYKNGGAFSESERKLIPILKNEEATRLLEAILESPGTYRAALAERLGVTATTVNWHLRRLRDAGLVVEVRQGRNAYLSVSVEVLGANLRSLATKLPVEEAGGLSRLSRFLPANSSSVAVGAGA